MIISDSMGRPWRAGITDTAIGVAGITAVTDPRGRTDAYGNTLVVTQVAIADELAAAGDLVKGKLGGIPVAVVRGFARDGKLDDDHMGSRTLIRGSAGRPVPARHGRGDRGRARGRRLGDRDRAAAARRRGRGRVSALTDVDPSVQQAFLGFLAARPDAMWRSCAPGHLTASAMVIDPSSGGCC